MNAVVKAITLSLLAVVLVACAAKPAHERMAARLAAYEAAAGAPVKSFRYFSFWSWEALGDTALAVYTRPGEAYLLEVYGPCNDLRFAHTITITSSIHHVYARFDRVRPLLGGPGALPIDCRIKRIRPIDVKQMKAALRVQRAVEAVERKAD